MNNSRYSRYTDDYSYFSQSFFTSKNISRLVNFPPEVIRYKEKDWTYCYIKGTGHRISYSNPNDWIEIVW